MRFELLGLIALWLDCSASSPADGGLLDPAGTDGGASSRCAVIASSVVGAGFADRVAVACDASRALMISDTYPAHSVMTGITGTNDQVPVPAPGYVSSIPLIPVHAASVTSIDAALGVAVNGVPIYDYTSQGLNHPAVYVASADTKLTGELDVCNGHAGRGDDYHYHAAPTCMMQAMANRGPAAIIGWAFDGYPIYGNTNPDGSAIASGVLDVCNAQADATFGFRYHTSDTPPYIVQCLVGQVDLSRAPRVAPMSANGPGPGKPPGSKPPGGVTNLTLVEAANGARTMTYDWNGKRYSIAYAPSSSPNCWDFAEESFTSGGVLKSATWCRP
jgi:YHYH protein